jgi:hypothetical protein
MSTVFRRRRIQYEKTRRYNTGKPKRYIPIHSTKPLRKLNQYTDINPNMPWTTDGMILPLYE